MNTVFMMLRKHQGKIFFGLIALGFLLGGWYWKYGKGTATTLAPQTTTVRRGTLEKSLSFSGKVEVSNLLAVSTKTSGVVKKVYVHDGETVKAGQKIAEITLDSQGKNNQSQAWSQYLSAKKSLEQGQASQFSSQSTLFSEWDQYLAKTNEDTFKDTQADTRNLPEFQTAQKDWLAAEANYKSQATSIAGAQASVSQAWQNYQLYQAMVTAPNDGIIVGLNIAEGLTLSYAEGNSGAASAKTVATIRGTGSPVASFTATEVDVPQLKAGQKTTMSIEGIPDTSFTGTLVAIDRVGSSTNGVTQYTALVKFDEADERLLPNMTLTAKIVLDTHDNALIIPTSALQSGAGGETSVRVTHSGQVQFIPVKLGLENDTEAEILEGLSEGEVVLLNAITTSTTTTSAQAPAGALFFSGPGGGTTRNIQRGR